MCRLKKVLAFISAVAVLGASSVVIPSVSADVETSETVFSDTETVSTNSETTVENTSDKNEYKKLTASDFKVQTNSDGTATLKSYSGNYSDIILPEEVEINGGKYTVTGLDKYCFNNIDTVKNVIIPDTYKKIDKWAFKACRNLETIKLSDKLEFLGQSSFLNCSSLKSIVVPESVTKLENAVFSGCSSLKKAEIKCKVTSVGMRMFDDCGSLEEVILPDGITEYQDFCFRDCKSLKEITIKETTTAIYNGAFVGCRGLSVIEIPDSVTSIGEKKSNKELTDAKAFGNCGLSINKFDHTEVHSFLIVGGKGSAAEKYAKENDEKFMTHTEYAEYLKDLEQKKQEYESREKTPPETTFVNYGDVNGDGEINSKDAVVILIEYANSIVGSESTLNDEQKKTADVNVDGKVNSVDAVIVLRYFANNLAGIKTGNGTMQEFVASLK